MDAPSEPSAARKNKLTNLDHNKVTGYYLSAKETGSPSYISSPYSTEGLLQMPPRKTSTRSTLLLFLTTVSTICFTLRNGFAQTCSTPSFTQPPIYAVGSDVRAMARADFDGDGHDDIALVDVNSDSLTVFMKLAQNTPVVANSYAVGRFPLAVAAGDFNSDGKPDLIVGNNSSFDLTLLLNDGAGHFIQAGVVLAMGTPQSIAVGDFNNDMKLDIAVLAGFGQNVTVFLGDGNGGFGSPHGFAAGQAPRQLVTADFNTDGKPDLAVTSQSGIQILIGDGAGNFAVSATCTLPASGIGLASGDLNGDTKPDLVIADLLANQIHVFLNNGAGCFTGSDIAGVGPRYITLRDMNNDAKLDIVGDTTIILGNGNGGFGTPVTYGTGSADVPGSNTVTGDFDGDGKPDVASAGQGSLSILLGDGAGGIRNAAGPSGRGVFGAARADLNSDGKLDLVYFNTGNVSIMFGNVNGSLSAPTTFPLSPLFLVSPVVADFTGDMKLDVAGLDSSNNGPGGTQRLIVLPGDGAGGLGAPVSTNFNGNQPAGLAGGDFNNDGQFDLLTINITGGNNNGGSISIFSGDGMGHFAAPTLFSVATSVNPKQVGIGDFNADGRTDLAIPAGGGFSIMIGTLQGSFLPPTQFITAKASSIVVADFNGDTKPDLAMVSGEPNNKLAVVLGDGQGSFGPATTFDIGTFPGDLTAADLNGDNKIDIAVANQNLSGTLSTVSVFFGDGAGSFGSRTDYIVERSPGQIFSGDLNGDGKPDLITANNNSNNFSILSNTCGTPVGLMPTVQFSAPLYSVNEDALMATITVTRSGDTSGNASVRYATSDGIASSRSDYISAFGTLTFAPGETTKTFNVLIIDDLRAGEASESLNLTLSSPNGATLGSPTSAVLAIQENDPTITNVNPIDSTDFFVRQHYFDFLNRVPDASGFQFWTNDINQCNALPGPDQAGCREVKRINVSAAFFLSIEFQQTGYLVYRTYKAAFGDTTSPNVTGTVPIVRLNEFLTDSQQLGQGVVVGQGNWEQQLEDNKVAYMQQFVGQTRFLTAFPLNMSAAEFVDKLNLNAGSVLTQLQRDQLVMQLSGAIDVTVGRAAVLRQVAENDLLRQQEFNRAFVLMQYFGYLRRNPNDTPDADFSGWKFWLDKLNQFNGNFVQAEMVKAFLNSLEYRNRFNSPTGF